LIAAKLNVPAREELLETEIKKRARTKPSAQDGADEK
jgi:hypothetical protein